MFRVQRSEARPPPLVPTQFAPIAPLEPATADASPRILAAAYPGIAMPPVLRIYAAPSYSRPAAPIISASPPYPALPLYSANSLDDWPLSRMAASSLPVLGSTSAPTPVPPVPAVKPGLDRLQLSSWALLRGSQAGALGPSSLANSGTLGGSQAGARLIYALTPQIALAARTSSDVGRRGGEVAAGVRVQPIASFPVWLTAERRQRIGRFGGGRNAFAAFAEAGIYQRPLLWGLNVDAYLQGGIVGLRHRDKFVDGAVTLSRPVYRQFSAGFGVWGGAQPGVYRVDAGPRISMRVRNNVRVHFDWRQRLAGKAEPGSGPAVTLSGDF